MTGPKGHSLPELIVAIAFLGIGLGGVGASSVLGARWTGEALRRQEAVRTAVAVLDSLVAAPSPASGTREAGRLRLSWVVREGSGPVSVLVETLEGRRLFELEGWRLAPVPMLQDLAEAAGGGP